MTFEPRPRDWPAWIPDFRLRPPGNDATMVRESWIENVYRLEPAHLTAAGVVLDLGANCGAFSLYAAWRGARRVVCYEPEPDNVEALRRNLEANAGHTPGVRFDVRAMAVHAATGPVRIAGGQSAAQVVDEGGRPVEARSLADVFAADDLGEVDFLKLDVEGSEYPIFEGATPALVARCRHIAMEFHRTTPEVFGRLAAKLMETHHLRTLGRPSVGGGYIWADRYNL